ncbi:hypothetical protein HYT05_03390, partial [Candidatus Kaiserbacteria bacterium]|nr:hypothetical protein [Candidatus Kaiserbacteria bacterium]
SENSITFSKASSTLTWSSIFAASGNAAPATAAGSAKKIRWRDSASNSPTPADTAQYGALSSLLKISTAGSGSPDGAITTDQTVYNRGETVTSSFYLYDVRSALRPSVSNLSIKATKSDYSAETTVASESSDTNGLVGWSYPIGSLHQATADTTGSLKNMVVTDVNNNVATSTNTWGVSSLLTVDNIWHALSTADASESSQFIIASDLMQVKNHVKGVRNTDKNGATVNSVLLDPSSNITTLANGTTGSDGWSAFQQVTPSAPSGIWTLKSSAYDGNGNAAASTTETITYTSPYTAKYGIRTIGWNQQYHKGDTATFVIQTLTKNASDDWTVTNVDTDTTPYYEIMRWTGSAWATTTARTNMTVQVASSTWTASYAIPNSDTEIGKKYTVSFNARIGGAQMSQLQEFAVVQQTAGDPITVIASPLRATAGDTVKLTIRESNLDATARTGNAAGTKVYIYDPNNTLQVNGAAPTEIGSGAYYYSYALGSSPTNGVWQALITTDTDTYSAATNFEVNYQVAKETSVNTGTSTLYTAITNASSSLGSSISSVKTKTDTITWGDITNLGTNLTNASTTLAAKITTLQSDVTTIKNNIATLITEIGTGNISAIKTKTDTILWGDITGLITTSGQIKAKTDTVAWADITAIKTKTDTILWTDITGIKTKTDTILWTDITTLGTNLTNASTTLAAKIDTASSSLGSRIDTSVTSIRGKILNQDTSIKSGNVLTLMYRAPSGLSGANVPVVNIYDPSLTQRVTDQAMSEIGTTGVYRATTTVATTWSTGNFTIVTTSLKPRRSNTTNMPTISFWDEHDSFNNTREPATWYINFNDLGPLEHSGPENPQIYKGTFELL